MADNKTKIWNTEQADLVLPNGEVVPAGGSRNVEGWDGVKKNDIVKIWVGSGALTDKDPSGSKAKTAPVSETPAVAAPNADTKAKANQAADKSKS